MANVAREEYGSLPWYRKSGVVSLLTLLGLVCGPAILVVCVIVLTGDVYYDKRDAAGRLKKWGVANKVAAVVILVLQVLVTAYQFGAFGGQAVGPQPV